jgi:sialic acid synthase SpsE
MNPQNRALVIAEAGVNHNGSLDGSWTWLRTPAPTR